MGRRLIIPLRYGMTQGGDWFIPLRYGMTWGGDLLFHFATACHGAEIGYSISLRHDMGRRLVISLRYGMTWGGD
jgi:uncharacterized protein YbbC (DUF1343 family)